MLVKHINWCDLVGALVDIRRHGARVASGKVADARGDSSVLWLERDGMRERTMFEAALGFEVWAETLESAEQMSLRHRHWRELIGVVVEIRHSGMRVATGIVDNATNDSSIDRKSVV